MATPQFAPPATGAAGDSSPQTTLPNPEDYTPQTGDPTVPDHYVNVRQHLTQNGVPDSAIGFNPQSGYVTVNGNDYYQPSLNIRGHTFADPNALPAVTPFLDQTQTPMGQQEQDILAQLQQASEAPLDVTQSPEYNAIQAAASQAGKLGGQQAEEDLNARGILNSSQTAYQVGQAQAQAQEQALPQEIAAAEQARQGRISNLQSLFGETNTLEQQRYNQQLQQEQARIQAQQQEITNAWNSVQDLGYVDNQAAIVLGLKAGTPSFDAQKQVETLMNQLNIAQQKNAATLQAAQIRADATAQSAADRANATITAAQINSGTKVPANVSAAERLLQSLTTQADSYRTAMQPVPADLQNQIDWLTGQLQSASQMPPAVSGSAGAQAGVSATPSPGAPGDPIYQTLQQYGNAKDAIASIDQNAASLKAKGYDLNALKQWAQTNLSGATDPAPTAPTPTGPSLAQVPGVASGGTPNQPYIVNNLPQTLAGLGNLWQQFQEFIKNHP